MTATLRHLLGSMLAVGVTAGLAAQQQASTVFALQQRAPIVVAATALEATDPSPEWHRLSFRSDEVLRGAPGAMFELREPAGRCCGRALFTLVPGATYLLFLERGDHGLAMLAGDRGAIALTPPLFAHVRALLANGTDPAASARVLAAALDHPEPRVRDDAAMALATLTGLRRDPIVHARVLAALTAQLPMPTTRLPSLAIAAARTDPVDAAATLVPIYLDAASPDAVRTLLPVLLQLPATSLGNAIAGNGPTTEPALVRALELLARTPAPANLPLLDRLLTTANTPRVALAAAEALLAHGRSVATLRGQVPPAVLDLAERRHGIAPPFRAVRPRSTP